MDKLPFGNGALVWTARGAAILHEQLVGSTRLVLVVEFVVNIGNNRPDMLEIENAAQRAILGIDDWRLATSDEVRQSVEKRRAALNAKLDALLLSLDSPLDNDCQ